MSQPVRRVAFVTSTVARSGPTQQLLNIAGGIAARRWRPVVITLSPEPAESRWNDFQAAGIELVSLGLSRWQGATQGLAALVRELERRQPDLIHSHGFRGDVLAGAVSGVPHVATVRNVPWLDYPMTYGLPGHGLVPIHLARLRRASSVVAVSATVMAALAPFVPRTTVIRNAVDLAHYYPASPEEKRSLRLAHGIPTDETVVVATGHLSERKNPLRLVRAALASGVTLLLVGDGPLSKRIAAEAAGHDNIRLVGRTSDVRPYLRMADLFASASTAEGFPNAVLEAMASGLPCVLSDIGPHCELAVAGGTGVRFFDAKRGGGADVLADMFATAPGWAGPAAGKRSRQFAEEQLGTSLMVQSYEQLYLSHLR